MKHERCAIWTVALALSAAAVAVAGCATTKSGEASASGMPANPTDAQVVARVQHARAASGLTPAALLTGGAYDQAIGQWRTSVESGTPPAAALVGLMETLREVHPGRLHPWLWDKTDISEFTIPPSMLDAAAPAFVAGAAKLPRDERLPVKYAVVIIAEGAER